ncbi:hypothetical protein B5C34_14305 [Pacificimonas flava]|uniref:TIGR03087 family PEP-CTERM/XrtA system glycosyltransferase n=2 Tax=Pacificimonas TaxID=1960290 RepID=A0A219B8L8_9SPHN|nr:MULTISPECIES: TIGR03087 family PEP-CTERM/XrtA system glycosyltransferase [Pacificimonas]MBZ6379997.1 TIGR03087 family PEP-CTERM/XrtA system glycosyltransferase [Pacificimonas aurantium]OWV34514.1 hypothetical protein B5C34_14305 [Pacificimonas flava]
MGKPQLLFLAHRIPYPPNKGDKIRSWNVLRHLAKSYDIHLGAFIDDDADWRYVPVLEELCASTCFLKVGSRRNPARLARAWLGSLPLSVALWGSAEMKSYVDDCLSDRSIQNAYVFSGQMAPYVHRHVTSGRTIIMDFVDVDSDKFRQYAATASWPFSGLYSQEAAQLKQFEKQTARVVDASLFVSEAEAKLFRGIAGSYGHTVYALENGVDLDFFSPAGGTPSADAKTTAEAGRGLVFAGAMDYPPNIEAVEWLVGDILPRVRRRVPGTDLTIVGSNPVPAVRRLARKKGVEVTGFVEDIRPYVRRAAISVAPIRTARGVQNKVLEAMAMGKPVVASSQAYSGINAEPGHDLLVADTADAFAGAVADLLEDGKRRARMGRAARAKMRSYYSWDARLAHLDEIMARHAKAG